jgi:hypothetical protein
MLMIFDVLLFGELCDMIIMYLVWVKYRSDDWSDSKSVKETKFKGLPVTRTKKTTTTKKKGEKKKKKKKTRRPLSHAYTFFYFISRVNA